MVVPKSVRRTGASGGPSSRLVKTCKQLQKTEEEDDSGYQFSNKTTFMLLICLTVILFCIMVFCWGKTLWTLVMVIEKI